MTHARRILRTRRARQDILEIWDFIAEDDPDAADAMLDAIGARCRELAKHPQMGPARDDIRPGLRYSVLGSYLILYEALDDGIKVVRLIQGRRDIFGLQLS